MLKGLSRAQLMRHILSGFPRPTLNKDSVEGSFSSPAF